MYNQSVCIKTLISKIKAQLSINKKEGRQKEIWLKNSTTLINIIDTKNMKRKLYAT